MKKIVITLALICMTMVTMAQINNSNENKPQTTETIYIVKGNTIRIICTDENGNEIIIEVEFDKDTDINDIINKRDFV